ncbi:PD-(D/E)XK nuclease family protein [Methanoregula sp. UBA64]|jgi:hypothetical protein|uniref:PD-(D/E)XK nuclease family protein n=1 Tax=Methanoregula sp. UBA64 TaxID=1915554 RepID=UPI0025DF997A|nr:PD-(D/E)XK nuclease family protein [Methanoregula sp. UBA64]
MSWSDFNNLNISQRESPIVLPSYSVTSDILSFQVCPRQYGFFTYRGYKSEHNVQFWFGTIIHQVLDKLHLQYKGLLNPLLVNQLPSNEDISRYFTQINSSLRARGIRAYNKENENRALEILKRFNQYEGLRLYPKIKDTECAFQSQRGTFILKGVVDILKDISEEIIPEGYEAVEILDYKASKNPLYQENTPQNQRKLRNYQFQLLVYAQLYRERTGYYPKKGILYFLNDLMDATETPHSPEQILMLRNQATYVVDFTNEAELDQIHHAMTEFESVVQQIENCKQVDCWDPPQSHPDRDTCDTCDMRWDCPHGPPDLRYP